MLKLTFISLIHSWCVVHIFFNKIFIGFVWSPESVNVSSVYVEAAELALIFTSNLMCELRHLISIVTNAGSREGKRSGNSWGFEPMTFHACYHHDWSRRSNLLVRLVLDFSFFSLQHLLATLARATRDIRGFDIESHSRFCLFCHATKLLVLLSVELFGGIRTYSDGQQEG